tara:strand:- start:275 stop:472 length:198 start_codon:yes stop_codon:yes gene_type:complete
MGRLNVNFALGAMRANAELMLSGHMEAWARARMAKMLAEIERRGTSGNADDADSMAWEFDEEATK